MSDILEFRQDFGSTRSELAHAGFAGRSILTAEGYDNTIRWRAGERLHQLFEQRCLSAELAEQTALDVDGVTLSFAELDQRANQLARYFRSEGLGAGDRVGLIVDRSTEAYAMLLAVLKIDAAYVPLDVKFPSDRIAFIAGDAGIKAFVTTATARPLVAGLGLPIFELGAAAQSAATFSGAVLDVEPGLLADRLCYIIYTSGSTGRPKGVAVNHSSICNFVAVAAEVYGYRAGDRVYQGMTLAFDFSVEELWVPLLSGATLVPSPADRQMVGAELGKFLLERRITAMCCVPTLLATIEDELPGLRLLLVSGEACPPDIVARWWQPWRRMLNAYGPTEATVTATWTEVTPDKDVTIGVPLPTYTIVMLETGRDALAAEGATGEVAIAGVGLAEGYVNRDDLTAKAFVPDFLQLADNPSRRLYRTGDLGRINDDGEIEYLGRIDTQVKIRGYRIELSEVENVLLEIDGIAQAVVTTHEAEPGLVELAAYYTCFVDSAKPSRERLLKVLRSRLPGYMVPAYVEELVEMPLLASHKADRNALPAPKGLRLVSSAGDFVAPRNELERVVAAVLAETMKLDDVSVDDHFFDDLGAHSLLMGQFLATLNARLPDVKAAISDVYLAPSVALLAAEIDGRSEEVADVSPQPGAGETVHEASDFDHVRCGALQAAFYVCHYAFYMAIAGLSAAWVSGAGELADAVTRAMAASVIGLGMMMILPIAAKWLVVGRWTEARIPIWSLAYFRFWMVRQLVSYNPWVAFHGTALFNVYLRLLGAKIGHGAMILTDRVPLATDLIHIGDYAVLRRHAQATGYRAENGYIKIGGVEIGRQATVGERGLVDIKTKIGDEGQLAHASALLEGQSIPAGKRYHGSPARETDTEFRHLPHAETSRLRRGLFAAARLLSVVAVMATMLGIAGVTAQTGANAVDAPVMWAEVLFGSIVLFVGGYVLVMAAHLTVPRLLNLLLVPGKVYPLYGFRHLIAQWIGTIGHVSMFQTLFGDSSAIVHYLRWAGVRQPDAKQTGSNFGTAVLYDSPFEVEVGSGSMISDGLWVVNLEMGSGSFRMAPARIGARSFLGNTIVYPAQARLGDNCLLGTKVMVPIDGKVRDNVGLLGSPAFEIPREVVNGQRFNPVPSTPEEHARLRDKNAFNLRTGLWHLTSRWTLLFGLMLIGVIASSLYGGLGIWAIVLGLAAAPPFVVTHSVIAERLSLGGKSLKAHNCTIHEPHFWWVERHWKLGETMVKYAFVGTPFRPILLRLLGLKVGRKVFDDGAGIAEKGLVEIGDNCCINASSSIQGHSLEDGLFKSAPIVIGRNCTIGPFAFVHYDVRMGDDTVLAPDAFLMKGATTEPGSYWQGNPARVV